MTRQALDARPGHRRLPGVLLLVLAVLLSACGGSSGEDAGASEEPAAPASPADGAAGGAAGGTRPAAVTAQEAAALEDGTPVVVEGTLFFEGDTWRLCGALMESFPPQCSPSDSVVITNPDAIPQEDQDALQEDSGVRWGEGLVTYAGTRLGEDGVEITGPADDPDLIGGDAAPGEASPATPPTGG